MQCNICGIEYLPNKKDSKYCSIKCVAESHRRRPGFRARNKSEYGVWIGMRMRCGNPNSTSYALYGGRGIAVCDRWQASFEDFYKDMGPRPSPQHSLDRINVDGNYDPSNCRWSTKMEQCNNKRTNHLYELGGETRTVAAWARHYGVRQGLVRVRLCQGWTIGDALQLPIGSRPSAADKVEFKSSKSYLTLTAAELAYIWERRQAGDTIQAIATALGRSAATVSVRLKAMKAQRATETQG
jgi:hypothetical protein